MLKKSFIITCLLVITLCLIWAYPLQSSAQKSVGDEAFNHLPAEYSLLIRYIEQYGYNVHQTIEAQKEKILHFKVRNEDGELFHFSILLLQNNEILMIHCHDVFDNPAIEKMNHLVFEKLTEINGKRTLGKYCLNKDKNKIRYFYYRTVVGGLCYADFKSTLETIEHIIFNDRKLFRSIFSK